MRAHLSILASVLILVAAVGAAPVAAADTASVSADSPAQTADQDDPFPITVTDATGTDVTLDERPERVTTTNPSAAQVMWELGAQDQVVGVTQYASYLEGAESRQNVSGSGLGVSVERVVDTNPDLVIAPNASAGQVEDLRNQGLTVYHLPVETDVKDVIKNTRTIGQLTGNGDAADETAEWVSANVDSASAATADAERPRLLYAFPSGFAAGDQTYINSIITASGADNVASEEFNGYQLFSDEKVLATDPEVLLTTDQTTGSIIDQSPYNSTTAGENNRSVRIDSNYVNQPAPRSVVYSTRNLTAALHPERYSDSDYVSRQEIAERPEQITTTVSPEDAVANGTDTLGFTVEITDANGDPVSGANVSVADTGANVSYADGTSRRTDKNGTVSIAATSPTAQESVTFSITEQLTNVSTTATGSFRAGEPERVAATVSSETPVADGSDPAEFIVTVDDATGNPVAGTTVTVEETEPSGALDGIAAGDTAVTNETGVVTFTATATEADSATVRFTQPNAGGSSATATFIEPPEDDSDAGGGGGASAAPPESGTPIVDAAPDSSGTTVAVESTDVRSITFSDPEADGSVTVDQSDDVPTDAPEIGDDRSAVTAFSVDVPDDQTDQPATVELTVSADRIADAGGESDDIVVLRAPDGADEYETLASSSRSENDEIVVTAETPGFSTFVLAVTDDTEGTSTADSAETANETGADTTGAEQPSDAPEADQTPNESSSATDTTTDTEDEEASGTDDLTPGFGVVTALAAFVAAALLATRRDD